MGGSCRVRHTEYMRRALATLPSLSRGFRVVRLLKSVAPGVDKPVTDLGEDR